MESDKLLSCIASSLLACRMWGCLIVLLVLLLPELFTIDLLVYFGEQFFRFLNISFTFPCLFHFCNFIFNCVFSFEKRKHLAFLNCKPLLCILSINVLYYFALLYLYTEITRPAVSMRFSFNEYSFRELGGIPTQSNGYSFWCFIQPDIKEIPLLTLPQVNHTSLHTCHGIIPFAHCQSTQNWSAESLRPRHPADAGKLASAAVHGAWSRRCPLCEPTSHSI